MKKQRLTTPAKTTRRRQQANVSRTSWDEPAPPLPPGSICSACGAPRNRDGTCSARCFPVAAEEVGKPKAGIRNTGDGIRGEETKA